MAHNFLQEGSLVKDAFFVGPWTSIEAEVDGSVHVIGVVKEGKIEVKDVATPHYSLGKTTRRIDTAVRGKIVVEFTGVFEEVNRENLLFFLNRDPNETKPIPDGEIQIHNLPTTIRFCTLRGKRPNATGTNDRGVEFCLWKCRNAELLRIASGDDWTQVPFKFTALSDVDGDYGGSADQPYGWIYAEEDPYTPPAPADPWDASPMTNWWRFSYSIADAANKNQRILVNTGGGGSVNLDPLTFFMIGRPTENWTTQLYPFILTATYNKYSNLISACHWMRHEQRLKTYSGPLSGSVGNCGTAFETFRPMYLGGTGENFTNGYDGAMIVQVTGGVASGWLRSLDVGDQTGGPSTQRSQVCPGSGRMELFGVEEWGTHCWEGRLYCFGIWNRVLTSGERSDLLKWADDPGNAVNPPNLSGGAPDFYFDCNVAPAALVDPHIDDLNYGTMEVNNHTKITLNG